MEMQAGRKGGCQHRRNLSLARSARPRRIAVGMRWILGRLAIRPLQRDLGDGPRARFVVVLHGAATPAVLSDAAWAARGKGDANPNSALIRSLIAAGVQVRLCGQAMAGNGIAQADLAPGVSVDLAALMTVIHLQQAGYALVVN